MKLFLIGWSGKQFGLIDVVERLSQRGYDICYWTGSESEADTIKSKFVNTIFHSHAQALQGKPAIGIDSSNFLPPGEKLLQQLYECESEILMMMNKRYEWMCVYERKEFYYSLVRYWHGVMTKLKPNCIIFSAVPHTVYDFVIYHLAKLMGIPYIMFDWTWVGDRLLLMNDYHDGCTALVEELNKAPNKKIQISDLDSDLQTYYLQQINPKIDSTPPSVNNFLMRYGWKNLLNTRKDFFWNSLKDGSIIPIIGKYILKKFTPNIRDEFLSVQVKVDLAQPFIYAPLHYQPEGTTSPLGGLFVDQILMIEILSAALPSGWHLYVKENPQQWQPRGLNYFSYRYKGFYKTLAKIPNVHLVPLETDTFELINASKMVATVSGTAGWEAILRNKPALIFGYPWYRHCHGVCKVFDVPSVQEAISLIQKGANPTAERTLQYLKSFGLISFHGIFDEYGRNLSSLTVEENIDNFVNILEKELVKISI